MFPVQVHHRSPVLTLSGFHSPSGSPMVTTNNLILASTCHGCVVLVVWLLVCAHLNKALGQRRGKPLLGTDVLS
jgi:hypothetical protein